MTSAIVNGVPVEVHAGIRLETWRERPSLQSAHVRPRKVPVTQLVLHRGVEQASTDRAATKKVLDRRELSSLFTLTTDGVFVQHFDPGPHRGAHATHHNVQSDSIDIQGPLTQNVAPVIGQAIIEMRVAIGKAPGKDGRPRDPASLAKTPESQRALILGRAMVRLRQWSLTPDQDRALCLFVPWWCRLRGIPLRACSGLRTFRVGGLGLADPVTNVTGILAHAQIAGPGERVDGFVELETLRHVAEGIAWRTEEHFWEGD